MTRRLLLLTLCFVMAFPSSVKAQEGVVYEEVVIALDISGSMTSMRLQAATSAATTFVNRLPAVVEVGLVVFGGSARIVEPVTSDHAKVAAALGEVKAYGKSPLYDAVALSLDSLTTGKRGMVVVLTDGKDTNSKLSFPEIKGELEASSAVLNVIAINPSTTETQLLVALTEAGNGRLLVPDGVDDFLDSFLEAYQSPSPSPTPTESSASPIPTETEPSVVPIGQTPPLLGLFTTLALLSILLVGTWTLRDVQANRAVSKMLSKYGNVSEGSPEAQVKQAPATETFLDRRVEKLRLRLDAAQLEITVQTWFASLIAGWFVSWLILAMLTRSQVFALIASVLLINRGSSLWLHRRVTQRVVEFEEQLPVLLSALASSLRAGLTFAQALDTAIADSRGEIPRQMRRALNETQVGSTLDESLMRVADRMGNDDLRWVVAGLAIQREVGGSLAKILDTAVKSIRNRAELRREVKTLSAEGRLSAYILIALPFVILAFLALTRPTYVAFFWSEPIGWLMMIAMLAAFATGWFWVTRLVRIRV